MIRTAVHTHTLTHTFTLSPTFISCNMCKLTWSIRTHFFYLYMTLHKLTACVTKRFCHYVVFAITSCNMIYGRHGISCAKTSLAQRGTRWPGYLPVLSLPSGKALSGAPASLMMTAGAWRAHLESRRTGPALSSAAPRPGLPGQHHAAYQERAFSVGK